MKSLKLWSGVLALLFSGIVIGASGAWIYLERKAIGDLAEPGPRLEKFFVQRLARELNLNEKQREQVEKIICRAHSELSELRQRNRPAREAVVTRGVESIRGLLAPDQQKKLDELYENFKEHRGRREQWRKELGPGRRCD